MYLCFKCNNIQYFLLFLSFYILIIFLIYSDNQKKPLITIIEAFYLSVFFSVLTVSLPSAKILHFVNSLSVKKKNLKKDLFKKFYLPDCDPSNSCLFCFRYRQIHSKMSNYGTQNKLVVKEHWIKCRLRFFSRLHNFATNFLIVFIISL